jgi:hypothetical protein
MYITMFSPITEKSLQLYYKEMCYDALLHERKIQLPHLFLVTKYFVLSSEVYNEVFNLYIAANCFMYSCNLF